jgi:alkanesulfonate monooxygenase SsuD/methylene tetrahydromethanopterin reductase-like flavin-dependent oxidoreductase (luciferase family)
MKFGIFFELQMAKPWAEDQEYQLFQDALAQAETADRLGIQYCWAQEHHFLEEYSHSTAPEVFLAAVSQRTKRMRLGHGVTLMPPKFNHPARVAERIGALDLVSGGRVEWGTGESSSCIELEGFEVNYVEKRSMWAEALRETAKMMSCTPYPGYRGKYFSMPCRNIIPKPRQRPHPPIWVACTNRDTMKLAARLGIGALTFAFMDAKEAKWWVDEYYDIFEKEAAPIGRAVNPNIAMLGGLMCHRDGDVARARGVEGQKFFKYGLAHYYRFGAHVPGVTRVWDEFKRTHDEPMAGLAGVGCPAEVTDTFAALEEAGVDQVILLQQAAGYQHEHIMESLELFGTKVLPAFIERDEIAAAKKAQRLEHAVAAAQARIAPIEAFEPPVVDAYPLLWQKAGLKEEMSPKRSLEGGAFWKLQTAMNGSSASRANVDEGIES